MTHKRTHMIHTHSRAEKHGEALLENPITMFSRFLADDVSMSTRWARNSLARMRSGRARRDNIAAAIINSLTKADSVSLSLEPAGLDGRPLDFRTSMRNQYVISVSGTPFRVAKANGQPVYRLTALGHDTTLFVAL